MIACTRPATAREFQAAVNAILRRSGHDDSIDERDAAFYFERGYTPLRAAAEAMDVDPTNRTPSVQAADA